MISVIVCAHNEEVYINECLTALFKQSYDFNNYEILIINDESTDKTSVIVEEFIQKNRNAIGPKIIYHKITHSGLSVARNTGIKLCSGDIVAFIDGDAVANVNWVEEISKYYEQCNTPAIIGGPIKLLNDNSEFARLIYNSFQSVEMNLLKAIYGTNMAFSKILFDEDTFFNPLFMSRGDETFVFNKIKIKFDIEPIQVNSIIVKHECPESKEAWLRTRFYNGYFSSVIDQLLNRENIKKNIYTNSLIFISFFSLPILIVIALLNFNPVLLTLLLLVLLFLHYKIFKNIFSVLKEYQKNLNKKATFKDLKKIFWIGLLGFFESFKGYLVALKKFKNDF